MTNVEKSVQLKKELDALRPLSKEDEMRIMQKFRLDWNYHSNHLEGNTLTYGETKALILFGLTAQGKPLKDHFEVTGHDTAVKWISEVVKQNRPLTENFIRELHTLILKESYEVDAITPEGLPTKKRVNVGVYKSSPNHVKTKTIEIFRFATPEETPAKMYDLIAWYRQQVDKDDTNAILLAAQFHYRYIRIHPFDDGNGRTARLLMNFILMQFGYPPVIIKTEDKLNYFAVLRQADAGLIEPFIEYIAGNLNQSLEIMIRGAKGESVEEEDDLSKEIALLEQRLNSVGKSVETSKSKDSILQIYDNSITKLAASFFEKGKLFEKFYLRSNHKISINHSSKNDIQETNKLVIRNRDLVKENTSRIKLSYNYQVFKHIGFEEFSYSTYIEFIFFHTRYTVNIGIENTYPEKLYGEQLSKIEIKEIVSSLMKKHQSIIEKKINKLDPTK